MTDDKNLYDKLIHAKLSEINYPLWQVRTLRMMSRGADRLRVIAYVTTSGEVIHRGDMGVRRLDTIFVASPPSGRWVVVEAASDPPYWCVDLWDTHHNTITAEMYVGWYLAFDTPEAAMMCAVMRGGP